MITIKQLFCFIIVTTSFTTAWCMEDETSLSLTTAKKQILLDQCTKILSHENYAKITSIAYHPQETQLASGSGDKTIRLWNTRTWECTNVLSEHTGTVKVVVYHPTHHQLASGSADSTIKLWNTETGQCFATLTDHTSIIRSLSYHPEMMQLASRSEDNTLKIWDLKSNECIHSFKDRGPLLGLPHKYITYHPNGMQIAMTTDYGTGITEMRLPSRNLFTSVNHDYDRKHNSYQNINALTYNKNGSQLAFGSSYDAINGYIGIIQKNGEVIRLYVPGRPITTIAFHPSENKISAGNLASGIIQTWDTTNFTEFSELSFDIKYSAHSLAYNPEGTELAAGTKIGTIHIINTKLLNDTNQALKNAKNLLTGFEKFKSEKSQLLSTAEKEQLIALGFDI